MNDHANGHPNTGASAGREQHPARHEIAEISAPHGALTMQITFGDGHVGQYPHELLRGYCPCAQCQGHQGPIRFVPGGDLLLRDIEEVGNYALRLVWGDGHGTGIYAFPYLRTLCACPACAPADPKAQVYSR